MLLCGLKSGAGACVHFKYKSVAENTPHLCPHCVPCQLTVLQLIEKKSVSSEVPWDLEVALGELYLVNSCSAARSPSIYKLGASWVLLGVVGATWVGKKDPLFTSNKLLEGGAD